ncbi:hypothetical protein H002_03826, partial [Escherichia coli UMEA 4075-1]
SSLSYKDAEEDKYKSEVDVKSHDIMFGVTYNWICPYISRHLLSLNPLLACCRRYSRGER